MGLFDHEGRLIKFDVLLEVASRAFKGEINEDTESSIAYKLIPTNKARFACCTYKEREVVRQKARMAMGKVPLDSHTNGTKIKQIVEVIEPACDGCTIKKIQITDNCRKCLARNCQKACRFDAIHMGINRAEIDYTKCKECGACANSCPFNAIVVTQRPCAKSCAVQAITWDENAIAKIDEEKCINCGACQKACPFGAIDDYSWIVPVVNALRLKTKMIAVVAPSIQGQFNATLPQIITALKKLGFEYVFEAGIGADLVAYHEMLELKENIDKGKKMTTSCCPAFVNLAKKHFPQIYEQNLSTTVSPMIAMGRYCKQHYPDHGVVFIGPCVAKKQEAMSEANKPDVDYVITYEEIAAIFAAAHIYPTELEETIQDIPSIFARNFAYGGGVSKAVTQAMKEEYPAQVFKAHYADGCEECKKALMLLKVNRIDADIIEGMACKGGCGYGPTTIESNVTIKTRMDKENKEVQSKNIKDVVDNYDFSKVNMHRKDHGGQ